MENTAAVEQQNEANNVQETNDVSQNENVSNNAQSGGAVKIKTVGTKSEVYNSKAKRTSGGLRKDDLMLNRHGRVVSKKQHARGKLQAVALKNWQTHLKKFHSKNPSLSLKEAMVGAKKTYKKTKAKAKKTKKSKKKNPKKKSK